MSSILIPTDPAGARKAAHDAIKALLEDIRAHFGIKINSVQLQWTAVGTLADRREVIVDVTTHAKDLNDRTLNS